MLGPTHLLAGVAVALTMPDIPSGLGALVGSLAPDLDVGPDATIANPFKTRVLNAPLRAVAWLTRKYTGHRGWLHRAPALLLLWTAGLILKGPMLGLAAGWTSHVLLDMLTVQGIKLFSRKAWGLLPKPLRMRTGGASERWLVRPALVGVALLVLVLRLEMAIR